MERRIVAFGEATHFKKGDGCGPQIADVKEVYPEESEEYEKRGKILADGHTQGYYPEEVVVTLCIYNKQPGNSTEEENSS